MFTFTKKNDKIAKCFYDHFEHVEESLENLEKFFEVLFSEKPDRNMLESLKTAIDNDEGAADQDLRRVVDAMSGAFLPTTRKNLISIVESTDEIANNCQNIARQIFHEKIVFPEELTVRYCETGRKGAQLPPRVGDSMGYIRALNLKVYSWFLIQHVHYLGSVFDLTQGYRGKNGSLM